MNWTERQELMKRTNLRTRDWLRMRFKTSEARRIEAAARQCGMSTAEYVRQVVMDAVGIDESTNEFFEELLFRVPEGNGHGD